MLLARVPLLQGGLKLSDDETATSAHIYILRIQLRCRIFRFWFTWTDRSTQNLGRKLWRTNSNTESVQHSKYIFYVSVREWVYEYVSACACECECMCVRAWVHVREGVSACAWGRECMCVSVSECACECECMCVSVSECAWECECMCVRVWVWVNENASACAVRWKYNKLSTYWWRNSLPH
jgi:hypothetical protein